MTPRTKTVIACCVAMMASGFTHAQLTSTQLVTSPFVKAARFVGVVAALVVAVALMLLPPRKTA